MNSYIHHLLLTISILAFSTLVSLGQNTEWSTLEKQFNNETEDQKKLEILNEMVDIAFRTDMEKALVYAKKGVILSQKSNDKEWLPKYYEMQGRMYANLLKLDSAYLSFTTAEKGYIEVQNKKGQATTYFKMAWVDRKNGNLDEALKHDIEGMKLMEAIDDKSGICDALVRISTDLTGQNRLNEAYQYAEKAIKIADDYNLTSEKFNVNINAANLAMAKLDFEASLAYNKKALQIATDQKIGLSSMADIHNNLGNCYKRLANYPLALENYKKSYHYAQEANYQNALITVTANLGEVNLLTGNFKEALEYQLMTVTLQESQSDKSNLIENYHHISTIYSKLNDYKSALIYKQKAYNLRDSIASKESDARMSELLTQYETVKKENTIAEQFAKISQQQTINYLFLGLIFLLFTILVGGYVAYRSRKQKNILLAQKNNENELLLKEIHHRVKNNLEVVSGLLALQSAQIDDPKTKDAMTESQNRVNSIGIVHQKLYQGTNLGAIEMKEYVIDLSESILDSFDVNERIKLQVAMEKLDLDIDTAVPLGLILNELITNTIKYAFPNNQKGTLSIQLEKTDTSHLHLVVSDNGIGKSGIIHGTGFGSQLISLLTQQLNGTMIEEAIQGTKFVFDFKLKPSLS